MKNQTFRKNSYWKKTLGRPLHDEVAAFLDQLAKEVKHEREVQKLTQHGLAELTGLSSMTIWNLEHGVTMPWLATVFVVLDALDLGITRHGKDVLFNAYAQKRITGRRKAA